MRCLTDGAKRGSVGWLGLWEGQFLTQTNSANGAELWGSGEFRGAAACGVSAGAGELFPCAPSGLFPTSLSGRREIDLPHSLQPGDPHRTAACQPLYLKITLCCCTTGSRHVNPFFFKKETCVTG